MARQAITGVISEGICSFCQAKIDKRKMTNHLKHCKQRLSRMAKDNATASEPGVRLFHLFVEGRYNPQYWIHLEIPASEELATLDDFLRAIWLECCGHLSAFRIDGTSYDSEPEEFNFFEGGEGVGEGASKEEGEDEELTSDSIVDFGKVLDEEPLFRRGFGNEAPLPADWLAEVRKTRSVGEFVTFAKEALKAIPKRGTAAKNTPEATEEYWRRYEQRNLLETLLESFEDRSIYVPLQSVLKVGQKFSHEYDFGSTTHLNLKVVLEREGHRQDKGDFVTILARNVPPAILCRVCGKPATQVASDGYYAVESEAYCDKCAKKDDVDTLPIVNSPRVGVCGYTGDAEWYGEEDEEEDEEGEDER